MKTLTTKVLNTFKRNGGNSVLYYAQNTKEQLDELNKAILELGAHNILPQFMEAEEGFVAVEFVQNYEYGMRVNCDNLLEYKTINGEWETFKVNTITKETEPFEDFLNKIAQFIESK